ncbi:hypothetical protein B0I35DRAFT_418688 [Stachybotrys elegans]|uniref:SET domain-containing protein n=1 Tax=Stachybotrys elegans TaxID=80388 RepID=A0A8K0T7R1_9HYPO|nr:hypothetical protein B0I35DRAFT_418688 [Stachybotrys elegans]
MEPSYFHRKDADWKIEEPSPVNESDEWSSSHPGTPWTPGTPWPPGSESAILEQNPASNHNAEAFAEPGLLNEDVVQKENTRSRRGQGVYTKRRLEAKRVVIEEAPAIWCIFWKERWGKRDIVSVWEDEFSDAQRNKARHRFKRLKDLPDRLDKKQKKQIMRFVKDYAFWGGAKDKAFIYSLGSHINHACADCANATVTIESEVPNIMGVRLRQILEPGQEIFIHYGRSKLPFGCAVCSKGRSRLGRLVDSVGEWWTRRWQQEEGE